MIDKLEAFLVLAREKHFGRAAEELGVAQPTLSAAIKQLEAELGVMLVNRGSRFGGLTPEGVQVLEWARRIVGDARTMRDELRAARSGLSGCLRLAVIPTALAFLPQLTAPLIRRHPGLTFQVLSRSSVEILSLLGEIEIDAGITYLDHEPLGRVLSVPFLRERYHLITRAGNAFAEREEVSWAEVASLPLCLLTPDMQNRRIIDRHLAQAGVAAKPTLESNSTIVLFSHVRAGPWCSIMPLNVAECFGLAEPMRAIPIVGPDAGPLVGLVAAPREPHTPQVQALLEEAGRLAAQGSRLAAGS